MRHIGILSLLLITAATGAADYFANPGHFPEFKTPLGKILLILLIAIFSGIITKAGIWALQKSLRTKEKSELKQITSVYRYGIWIILILVIIVLLYGVIGPAITSVGLLAAGLTLALQRPIMDLAGWFSIVGKRHYRIGDRVEIGAIGGYVHEVTLMHTHLSLVEKDEPTGKVVYIPNEQALTQPIVNYTKGSALVWNDVKVRVPPRADVKKVQQKLLESAEEVVGREMKKASRNWKAEVKPEVRTRIEYTPANEPYVELELRYLSNVKELQATRSKVTKRILSKLKKGLSG